MSMGKNTERKTVIMEIREIRLKKSRLEGKKYFLAMSPSIFMNPVSPD
jgi:hypothetical protein